MYRQKMPMVLLEPIMSPKLKTTMAKPLWAGWIVTSTTTKSTTKATSTSPSIMFPSWSCVMDFGHHVGSFNIYTQVQPKKSWKWGKTIVK
jgi:hypothetical protein